MHKMSGLCQYAMCIIRHTTLKKCSKLRYDVVRTGNDMGPAAFLSASLKYSYNEYFGENGE